MVVREPLLNISLTLKAKAQKSDDTFSMTHEST